MCQTVSATVPDPPINLAVDSGSVTSTTARISWNPPANNGGSAITGYPIWWDQGTGEWEERSAINTDTSDTINGLTANNLYKFKVLAKNAVGESAFSSRIEITTTATTVILCD